MNERRSQAEFADVGYTYIIAYIILSRTVNPLRTYNTRSEQVERDILILQSSFHPF